MTNCKAQTCPPLPSVLAFSLYAVRGDGRRGSKEYDVPKFKGKKAWYFVIGI
ncbi:MAG: hypothetical protein KAU38_01740 [Desulfobacterales bacterium]|nr:hypothetical protein [Desulfobacterales bacterium]